MHPPSSFHSVQTLLLQDNARHAREHAQARLDERPTNAIPVSRSDAKANTGEDRECSVGPTHAWLHSPIVARSSVGHDLLDQATSSIRNGAAESLTCPFRMDIWSSPFTVGYLNVGRRHLVGSLQEVVELVLRHRRDILFLGDLVTSRNHIGRLKKRLESGLHYEWFVFTQRQRSARESGSRSHPDSLCKTLQGMTETARQDGHRMAILGDFNAAPPGGRWEYSSGERGSYHDDKPHRVDSDMETKRRAAAQFEWRRNETELRVILRAAVRWAFPGHIPLPSGGRS